VLVPTSVQPVEYYFNAEVQPCVASIFTIDSVADVSMQINSGPRDILYTDATFANLACLCTVTHSY
jgi:hypothetical protein